MQSCTLHGGQMARLCQAAAATACSPGFQSITAMFLMLRHVSRPALASTGSKLPRRPRLSTVRCPSFLQDELRTHDSRSGVEEALDTGKTGSRASRFPLGRHDNISNGRILV